MMKLYTIIWIFSAGLLLPKACEIDLLRGSIKSCVSEDGAILQTIPQYVGHGTNCLVETGSVLRHLRCDGEDWYFDNSKGTSGHNVNKRGILGLWSLYHICLANLFPCLWTDRAGPPPVKTKPWFSCVPLIIHGVAEPFETYLKVSWDEPTAHGKNGEPLRVRRNGKPPGSFFPEGDTTVTYFAKDNSGNEATCEKTIRVQVKRCQQPTPIRNGYYVCHSSTDFILGGWCRFICYGGFDLHGESLIVCTQKETWSAAQPTCKALTCPEPKLIPGASLPTCTDGNRFRSICSYNCKTGFDMPAMVSKTMVCSNQKMWRQFGEPKCIDSEPPTFETCPDTKVFRTNRGIRTSQVLWNEPKVRDNSGVDIAPVLTTSHRSGSILPSGIYSVEYTAVDGDGNKAKPCKFNAIVRDMRCPKLFPTPYVRMVCPDGYRTGSGCNITCDPGNGIEGSDYVICEESKEGTYGYWNWMNGQQTTCFRTHHCETIEAPEDGAVVCDNWSGGEFCQLQCTNGTQMSGVDWRRLFVCSSDGDWFPRKPNVRSCTKTSHPTPVVGIEVNFYFDGDCSENSTTSRIGDNFVQVLSSSLFKEACLSPDDCSKDNVMITCGITSRTKRDITNNSLSQPMELSIQFNVPITRQTSPSTTYDQDSVRTLINQTQHICRENITELFGSSSVDLINVNSVGIDVVCKEGYVKVDTSLSCVECPAGMYFSRSTRECIHCSTGTYQDRGGKQTCRRCPFGTTSRMPGASSVDDCEDACFPGTFANDGVLPCSPCEIGQYQPSYGQIKCLECEGTKTTLKTGSLKMSDCEEFDINMSKTGNTSGILTLPAPKVFSDFITSFWVRQEPENTTADPEGLDIIFKDEQNKTSWHIRTSQFIKQRDQVDPYFENGTQDTRWQNVHIVYRNCVETGFLNGVPIAEYSSNDSCEPISLKTILFKAENGYDGSISQFNMWNGTSFKPSPSKCVSDKIPPSLSWHEFGNARLTNSYIQLPSLCDDFDDCLSSPCINGNCTDALAGFHCDCDRGFTGSQCDVDIDDCEINVCMNNATCLDDINGYKCACTPSYTGTYCEIQIVDGQWSHWSNWTECTTTCGAGQRKRIRLCNNPHPDTGGRYCPDESYEIEECNNTVCPGVPKKCFCAVCSSIEPPSNGTMECQNVSDSITCTISCDEGFDFDMQPLDNYTCGPDTFYEWNIQNDENPEGRLPKCSEIVMPEKLSVHYIVHYRDLFCTSDDEKKEATDTIKRTFQTIVNTVACISLDTCRLDDFKVIDCTASRLQKRKAASAGVAMTISVQPNEETKNGTLELLQDAFRYLQHSAENGSFTVYISDVEYELDLASTSLKGEAKCSPGSTRVRFYCVPCGRGSYAFEDYCKPCKRGTYQDMERQMECQPCPYGTTTYGIGSDHIQDCSVPVLLNDVPKETKVTSIVVGSVCGVVGLVVLVILVISLRRYRSGIRKACGIDEYNLTSRQPSKNYLNGLGPYIHNRN